MIFKASLVTSYNSYISVMLVSFNSFTGLGRIKPRMTHSFKTKQEEGLFTGVGTVTFCVQIRMGSTGAWED